MATKTSTPARKRVAVVPAALATPSVVPDPVAEAAAAALEEDEQIQVNAPRAFTLTRDGQQEIRIRAGVQMMPLADAEHWWSKAQGVVPYSGDGEAA